MMDAPQSQMEGLRSQCNNAEKYPLNMPLSGHPKYAIDLKYKQLNDQTSRLFREDKPRLEFLEFSEGGRGLLSTSRNVLHTISDTWHLYQASGIFAFTMPLSFTNTSE